jgi:hypothetical protein
MIPDDISRAHVLEAILRIDRQGVTPGRSGLKYRVLHRDRPYPPKLLISLAHEVATGRSLPSSLFSGGVESNHFLQRLGFTVQTLDGDMVRVVPRTVRRPATGHDAPPTRSIEDIEALVRQITHEQPLYCWKDLVQDRTLLPVAGGVYAWFFRSVPKLVPTTGCLQRDGLTLLYVGISPKSAGSAASLRSRIGYLHYRGNAEASTLRLSLGCLLEKELGTVLRRVGSSGKRRTFGAKEPALTEWLAENAAVTWILTDEPWLIEAQLISHLSPPLNIEMNAAHGFCSSLRQLRVEARQRAGRLPILNGY